VAQAYDGAEAAAYSDRYAINPNGSAWYEFDNDCTNFVSQAMMYGGHRFSGKPVEGISSNPAHWWASPPGASRTFSWSVASSLFTYLKDHDPAVTTSYEQPARVMEDYRKDQPSHVQHRLRPGDPLFYNWGTSWGHAGIITRLHGVDPDSGWVGTLVNTHSIHRTWAIWHLRPYNRHWPTTRTAEFHINP
jgi:hypothetical protein